jgi:hypothetical protein
MRGGKFEGRLREIPVTGILRRKFAFSAANMFPAGLKRKG